MQNKILVIYNEIPVSSDGEVLERKGNNKPEYRQKLIIEKLKSSAINKIYDFICIKLSNINQDNDNNANREFLISCLKQVHDSKMIDFLQHCYSDWKNDTNENGENDTQYLGDEGLIPINFSRRRPNPMMTKLWKNIGYYAKDIFTPINETTFTVQLLCCHNVITAASFLEKDIKESKDDKDNKDIKDIKEIKDNKEDNKDKYKVIYCCNSAPGHHADTDSILGYCHTNSAAVLARCLHTITGEVIAMVDIDYHSGNGQQQIFWKDKNILTISIHINPLYDFPSFEGYEDEIGEGEGEGMNMNIPLPPKTALKEYLAAVEKAKAKIISARAKYLIIPFGADTFVDDPEVSNLGGFALRIQDYNAIGKSFAELQLPIIVTQEGGYSTEVGNIVHNFLQGLIK